MRLILALARLAVLGAFLVVATCAAVALHALWMVHLAPPAASAATIIVLGGGMNDDNTLGSETATRTRAGVALLAAGSAPRIHFTGGIPDLGQPAPGEQMRALALSLGAPAEAITTENASRSTLENARLSRAVLGPHADAPVLLVTDGFHLARAWASFRWAGYGPVRLHAATAFGNHEAGDKVWRVFREGLAWWFNLARVALYESGSLAGVPERRLGGLLP